MNDTNGVFDVFVRDRQSATTERVSVGNGDAQGNSGSVFPSISADARYVAFQSIASNLVSTDTNIWQDVFVRDRTARTTELVSLAGNGAVGDDSSFTPSMTPDGRYVVFTSSATNLVPGDTNAVDDVFVRDRLAGTTERVSVGTGGSEGNGASGQPSVSADGRFVAFRSEATNLVPGDSNGMADIFVHDRDPDGNAIFDEGNGVTVRVSVGPGGIVRSITVTWGTWRYAIAYSGLGSTRTPAAPASAKPLRR